MTKAEKIQKAGKLYIFKNVVYRVYSNSITFVDILILVTTAETLDDID